MDAFPNSSIFEISIQQENEVDEPFDSGTSDNEEEITESINNENENILIGKI